MIVRCFASSESRTPPLNLGQEDELVLNGQHQLHRGKDSLDTGQHHHKEREDQARHGKLVHQQRQEHNVSGLLYHQQREDQDFPGQRLLQQRHHHHLFPESPFPQTQDKDDLKIREPHFGAGGTKSDQKRASSKFGYNNSICKGSVPTEGKIWIKFTFGVLTLFGDAAVFKKTGSASPHHQHPSCNYHQLPEPAPPS